MGGSTLAPSREKESGLSQLGVACLGTSRCVTPPSALFRLEALTVRPVNEQSSVLEPLSHHLILHYCLPWVFQL